MIFYENNRTTDEKAIYHQKDECLAFPMHLHSGFEFICVYDGELELNIDGNTYTLCADSAALILPNQIHNYATKEFSSSYLCVFSESLIYDFYESTRDKAAEFPIFPFNDFMTVEKLQEKNASHYIIKSCLYLLVDCFMKNAHLKSRNIKNFDCVSKILQYVETNFTNDISIKSLASHLGYDYHYLSGIINRTLGVSFPSILNEYRIQLAQHLLASTDKTATEISSICGYDSIRSFNRNFKAITGKTPNSFDEK